MKYQYHDGGRKAAGYSGVAGDCVTRAIAIAAELPYQQVYDALTTEIRTHQRGHRGSARNGDANKRTIRRFLESLGWVWTPTMTIGSGCRVHLRENELPTGRLVVNVSKHMVAVIDGTIFDTYDCSRDGARCVYGYWRRG